MPAQTLLHGYRVLGRIAVGGMAEIYRARALEGPLAGRDVVLKRLLPMHATEPGFVGLFLAEARWGALVDHPNVVRTVDLLHVRRDLVLVQEFVDGPSLADLMNAASGEGARVDPGAALLAVADLLAALGHLHGGVGLEEPAPLVHRDVSPSNLVIGRDGTARLIDFGVAETAGAGRPAREGRLRGTPAYMSPEQVRGRAAPDPRSDLFSVGVILWELLAGRSLFAHVGQFETLRRVVEEPAPRLRAIRPGVPASLDRLCARALEKARDRRFQSAGEFLAALGEAAASARIFLDRARLAIEVDRRWAPGALQAAG